MQGESEGNAHVHWPNETFNHCENTILLVSGNSVKNRAFGRDSDASWKSMKGIKGILIDLDGVLYLSLIHI